MQNDWSTLVPSLERGTFDVALNGLEVTPARADRIAFTRPYYLFAERLVARAGDERFHDLASLRGRRVGTLANSQAWDMLLGAGAAPVPYEGTDESFIDLERGRTDAVPPPPPPVNNQTLSISTMLFIGLMFPRHRSVVGYREVTSHDRPPRKEISFVAGRPAAQ